jgi:hypothetical protein
MSTIMDRTTKLAACIACVLAAAGPGCKGTGNPAPSGTDRPALSPADLTPASSSVDVDAAEPSAADVLVALRVSLDRVRAVAPDDTIRLGEPLDVSALAGATQEEIREALGEPETCENDMQFAPCIGGDPTNWFYSFYHLQTGSLGGGPELLLEFSADGRCTRASWAHTR